VEADLVALISELKKKEAIEVTEQRLNAGEDPLKILDDARKAMQIVGAHFSNGVPLKALNSSTRGPKQLIGGEHAESPMLFN